MEKAGSDLHSTQRLADMAAVVFPVPVHFHVIGAFAGTARPALPSLSRGHRDTAP
jgi:hypothetical protein